MLALREDVACCPRSPARCPAGPVLPQCEHSLTPFWTCSAQADTRQQCDICQPTATAGAMTSAWFARRAVSPIFLACARTRHEPVACRVRQGSASLGILGRWTNQGTRATATTRTLASTRQTASRRRRPGKRSGTISLVFWMTHSWHSGARRCGWTRSACAGGMERYSLSGFRTMADASAASWRSSE